MNDHDGIAHMIIVVTLASYPGTQASSDLEDDQELWRPDIADLMQ